MQEGTRKQGLDVRTEPCMLAANVLGLAVDVFKEDRLRTRVPSVIFEIASRPDWHSLSRQ